MPLLGHWCHVPPGDIDGLTVGQLGRYVDFIHEQQEQQNKGV